MNFFKKRFLILCLIVAIISCFFMKKNNDIKATKDNRNNIIQINEQNTNELTALVNAQEIYNNPDIVGKITIPGTDINYNFVQGNDNKYYVRRNLNKETDPRGSIFLDYRNKLDDRKLLIYGHNSTIRKSWFNDLAKYADKNFATKHSKIYLETENDKDTYEIFSIKIISNTTKTHMKLAFNDVEFEKHISWLKENSIINSNAEIGINDQILTLQTCFYSPKNSFLLISAKKI